MTGSCTLGPRGVGCRTSTTSVSQSSKGCPPPARRSPTCSITRCALLPYSQVMGRAFGLRATVRASDHIRIRTPDPDQESCPHGARPVHLIVTMVEWTRTSRMAMKNSPSSRCRWFQGSRPPPIRSSPPAARLVIYCQTTGVSAALATHCATYCTPCRPLIRAFSGWIRTPPPTALLQHHPMRPGG